MSEHAAAMTADYLVTGAGGGVGGVSRTVVDLLIRHGATVRAMVHREDDRAEALRALGAQVTVGDLTRPEDVVAAMRGVRRMFFNMSVSSSYLTATAIVCAAAREHGGIDTIVNMSQMTVSQMTLTSTTESHQHRLHWLAEQVMDWSALPVVHVRPTVFIDNPLFTLFNAESVRERHVLALPFGDGRTSPIAASDVARVVAELLLHPEHHGSHVYELTGPHVLDVVGLAQSYSRALQYEVRPENLTDQQWREQVLAGTGLPSHVEQHIVTMARLHRDGRYDRLTDDVERVTGQPPMTVEQYITENRQWFAG